MTRARTKTRTKMKTKVKPRETNGRNLNPHQDKYFSYIIITITSVSSHRANDTRLLRTAKRTKPPLSLSVFPPSPNQSAVSSSGPVRAGVFSEREFGKYVSPVSNFITRGWKSGGKQGVRNSLEFSNMTTPVHPQAKMMIMMM